MAEITNNPYVKFLRGTPTAYAALNPKDNNTLYFIVSEGASVGKLYLGDILVAGNVTPDGTNIIDSLAELIDVNLQGLGSGMVLVYDGETDKWTPKSLTEAASAVMVGATATTDGASGLVPAPQSGDENKFLRGDGTWVEITGSDVDLTKYATTEQLSVTNENVQTNTNAIDDLEEDYTELQQNYSSLQNSMTWGTL